MADLSEMQARLCEESETDYSDLSALFINCTLKRSPETSNTRQSYFLPLASMVSLPDSLTVPVKLGGPFSRPFSILAG